MNRREEGFSLVEMLAALAILAIAGAALVNAMTSSVRSAAWARDVSLAGLAADNVLALNIAGAEGQELRARDGVYDLAGVEYSWRLRIEGTGDPNLERVTLIISVDDRERARRTTFVRAF